MKTIKQLVDIYKVSDTAIRKRLKSLGYLDKLNRNSDGYIIPDDIVLELNKIYINTDESNALEPKRTDCGSNECTDKLKQTSQNQNEQINELKRTVQDREFQISELKQTSQNQNEQINELKRTVQDQRKMLETSKNEIESLKITAVLHDKLKEDIELLKADKSDLQKHRDNLTAALTVSRSDLARLENIITKMAAMPLRTRVFGWSGAVAQLTTESEETVIEIDDVQENIK